MRTRLTIMGIVLGVVLACVGILVLLMVWFGPLRGLLASVAAAALILAVYVVVVGPWQRRWGATDTEVSRWMPGDELLDGASSVTRAIGVAASPEQVWPWLVQIGYGRAGWYSYDWIDNDGRPSADRIVPEYQTLRVGDRILMAPDLGPSVRSIEPSRFILSDGEADTWCLAVYPDGEGGTRLVSRWHQAWPRTAATFFWIAISDPGSFIMERRMMKGIKARAERAAAIARHPSSLARALAPAPAA